PDPEPLFEATRRLGVDQNACLLVGDSDTDRNTARAAGVPSVLVTFGPSGEDMAALDPEALLDDYAALPSVAAALLAG
ncbi:MAG: HAD hydrolase-like protein, partial [Pseudomonadota bacterium]